MFTEQPHILRNVLLYRLYSDVFPGLGNQNYGAALLGLTREFFQLKMLSAIWFADHQSLGNEQIVTLFSAWFLWGQNNPREENMADSADFSLLNGLSLI